MAELNGSTRIRLSRIIGVVHDDSPQKELRHIEYDTSSGKHVEYDRLCNVQGNEKPNFSESDKDLVIKDLLNPKEMPMYVDFSRENYNRLFPEGKVKSPIGDVKISPHQYERMDEKKRNAFLGFLYQVLKRPTVVIKDVDDSGRPAKLFIKSFLGKDKKRFFMGVVPTIDDIDVVVSAGRREQSQLVKKIKTASICYYKAAGGGPTARTGETPLPGDLKITQDKAIVNTLDELFMLMKGA